MAGDGAAVMRRQPDRPRLRSPGSRWWRSARPGGSPRPLPVRSVPSVCAVKASAGTIAFDRHDRPQHLVQVELMIGRVRLEVRRDFPFAGCHARFPFRRVGLLTPISAGSAASPTQEMRKGDNRGSSVTVAAGMSEISRAYNITIAIRSFPPRRPARRRLGADRPALRGPTFRRPAQAGGGRPPSPSSATWSANSPGTACRCASWPGRRPTRICSSRGRRKPGRSTAPAGRSQRTWLRALAGPAAAKHRYPGPLVTATEGITPRPAPGHGHGPDAPDPHAWQDVRPGTVLCRDHRPWPRRPILRGRGDRGGRPTTPGWRRWMTGCGTSWQRCPPERRVVVTSHAAFGYFAAAYGVRVLAPQGIAPKRQPSAAQVAGLIRQSERSGSPRSSSRACAARR